jgi:hypothetical protein
MNFTGPTHGAFKIHIPLDLLRDFRTVIDVIGLRLEKVIPALLMDELKQAIRDPDWLQVNVDCELFALPSRAAALKVMPRYLDYLYPDPDDILRDGYKVVRWNSGTYGIVYDQARVDQIHNIHKDETGTPVEQPLGKRKRTGQRR